MRNRAFLFLVTMLTLCSFHSPAVAEDLSALADQGAYTLVEKATGGRCPVKISYPVFGRPALDRGVSHWVNRYFEQNARGCADAAKDMPGQERLWNEIGSGRVASATRGTVSIHFAFMADGGGAHPIHPEYTLVLNAEGRALDHTDLFANPGGLWAALSKHCFTDLQRQMTPQDCFDAEEVRRGLSPTADSFSLFLVTPQGLTMIFPEYQVAAFVCGSYQCEVPARVLMPFAPKPGI